MAKTLLAFLVLLLLAPAAARADDGYRLWLRYDPVEMPQRAVYAARASEIVAPGTSPIVQSGREELERGLAGLLAKPINAVRAADRDGAILLVTPDSSAAIAALHLPLGPLGDEGYLIRSVRLGGHSATVIAANSDRGLLYGAFAFLRLIQTRQPIDALDIADAPKVKLRMLDHWDNPDRWVERGYAGQSLWDWWQLPEWKDPRYTDYARADASIGINGAVLNNVNAKADALSTRWLEKAAALADAFRPWGVRVYLSARFSAPIEIGGLKTADPLDPRVRAWWKAKADEIYRLIPDFGGFLVKANSEGEPGPQDYKRSHADGANMFAEALAPHGGIVIWRAFVYSSDDPEDRTKQAYNEFKPLDGKFAPNVILQVKNGPLDFQPREPFHPLFGAMPKTPLGLEVQITKEYLGFATHLAYLGTMWEEVLAFDTTAHGPGSTVAKVVDGTLDGHGLTLMAGVANTGTDRNWSGSQFNQANWYAFGRLAWDPQMSGARDRRGMDADDMGQRSAPGRRDRADDDGLAPGGGRLHDAARPRASHGLRPSLRSGAVGEQYEAAGMEPGLLSPRRREGHRLRPDRDRQQCRRPICAGGGAALRRSAHGRRRLPPLVPSCAVGLSARHRPHALGRTGPALHRRSRESGGDAADLGHA